jgi:hypothetical protein
MSGKRDRGRDTSETRRISNSSMQDVANAIFGGTKNTALQTGIVAHDDGSVTINNIRLTSTGLVIDGELQEDQWLDLLYGIERIKRAYVWILADWLRYGLSRKYGQTEQLVAEISEVTGYSIQALNDFSWIAGAIEISSRKENLGIKHHKLVASMVKSDQEYWLTYADENNLSASDLEAAIQGIEVVNPSPLDKFLKRWTSFSSSQFRLAKHASNQERKKMIQELRKLADDIEALD